MSLRPVNIDELEEGVKVELLSILGDLNERDVKIFEGDIIPVRIQHIVNELSKKGYVIVETVIINGRLFIISSRRSNKDLGLAPDYDVKYSK